LDYAYHLGLLEVRGDRYRKTELNTDVERKLHFRSTGNLLVVVIFLTLLLATFLFLLSGMPEQERVMLFSQRWPFRDLEYWREPQSQQASEEQALLSQ